MAQVERWSFRPSQELRDIIAGFGRKLDDWSPVMQQIAVDMESFVEGVVFPSHGEGAWKPLALTTLKRDKYRSVQRMGILRLSGLLFATTGRDWSKKNAVVLNGSPHAHLVQYGTRRYKSTKYVGQERNVLHADGTVKRKTRRRSRGEIRSMNLGAGTEAMPARFFVYVSDERSVALYEPWILDYFFSEVES